MVLLLATVAHARALELAPMVGLLTSGPFVRQGLFGATLTVHANDVLGAEVLGAVGPRGLVAWANNGPRVQRLLSDLSWGVLDPHLTTVEGAFGGALRFTPLRGSIGERRPVGLVVSALLGTGLVRTRDVIDGLPNDVQVHPMLQVGASARLRFSPAVAWTLDARRFSFIEVVEADTLDTKQPVLLSTGLAWSPGRR